MSYIYAASLHVGTPLFSPGFFSFAIIHISTLQTALAKNFNATRNFILSLAETRTAATWNRMSKAKSRWRVFFFFSFSAYLMEPTFQLSLAAENEYSYVAVWNKTPERNIASTSENNVTGLYAQRALLFFNPKQLLHVVRIRLWKTRFRNSNTTTQLQQSACRLLMSKKRKTIQSSAMRCAYIYSALRHAASSQVHDATFLYWIFVCPTVKFVNILS